MKSAEDRLSFDSELQNGDLCSVRRWRRRCIFTFNVPAAPAWRTTRRRRTTTDALRHSDEIDAAIGAWMRQRSRDEVLAAPDAARVPAARVYTVAYLAQDLHCKVRGRIVDAPTSDGLPLKTPGIVPKPARPGRIVHAAPRLGEHVADLQRGGGWPVRDSGLP